MRILVLSDTHGPRHWKACPPAVRLLADTVDVILHAGDVCTVDVLTELQQWGPVHAVRGNNDGTEIADWGAADTAQFELDGVRFAMIHDSGPATGRAGRLRRRFPDAHVVVFGHSHIPWCSGAADQLQCSGAADQLQCSGAAGQLLFNPGSPTDRRRQPHGTVGIITVEAGAVLGTELLVVS